MSYHIRSGYDANTGGLSSSYHLSRDQKPERHPQPLKMPDLKPLTPADFPEPADLKFPDLHKPTMPKPPRNAAHGYV